MDIPSCLHVSFGMMMTVMIMINYFCTTVDWRKELRLTSSRDHCQTSSPMSISKKKNFFPLNNRTTCWIVGKFSNNCKVLISEPVWGSLGFLSTRLQCFDFGKHAVVQNKDC